MHLREPNSEITKCTGLWFVDGTRLLMLLEVISFPCISLSIFATPLTSVVFFFFFQPASSPLFRQQPCSKSPNQMVHVFNPASFSSVKRHDTDPK